MADKLKCMLCCASLPKVEDMAPSADDVNQSAVKNSSVEESIEALKKLLSEKSGLEDVAAAKIKLITAELDRTETEAEPFDPVHRLKSGFDRFKSLKYEYVQ
uniref:Uncharacterized protein n=2 Tax=Kalanchoe fedtschenkoi TaxID=63787 RepID=A0A7N0TEH4_KALFE